MAKKRDVLLKEREIKAAKKKDKEEQEMLHGITLAVEKTADEYAKEAEEIRQAIAEVDADIAAEEKKKKEKDLKREAEFLARQAKTKAESDDHLQAAAKADAKAVAPAPTAPAPRSSEQLKKQAEAERQTLINFEEQFKNAWARKNAEIQRLEQQVIAAEKAEKEAARKAKEEAKKRAEEEAAEEARKQREEELNSIIKMFRIRDPEAIGKFRYLPDQWLAEQVSPGAWTAVYGFQMEDGSFKELTSEQIMNYFAI